MKCRRRHDDKACDEGNRRRTRSTPRCPRKHNAVSVDDCGTAVDNLCMIPAEGLKGLFAEIEIAQDAGRYDQQTDELRCGE